MPELPIIPRFDGARAWERLPPPAQALIGALALELVASWRAERVARDSAIMAERFAVNDLFLVRPALLERAAEAADHCLTGRLLETVLAGVPQLAQDLALIPSRLGRVCSACGCSDEDACDDPNHGGPCCWVSDTRCSACAHADAKAVLL